MPRWLLAPLVLPEFYVTLLNYIGLYAIVALGLVLLTGVGGLTSFGQAAFVGLGAYTTACLTTAHGVLALADAVHRHSPSPRAVASVLGFITLRLSGHYLPLGTIAWGISLYFLFGNVEFLGGHTGITGIPPVSAVRLRTQVRARVLLPDLGRRAAGHRCRHPQPARFARGPGHPRAQGRHA